MQNTGKKNKHLLSLLVAGALFWLPNVSQAAELSLDEAIKLALVQNTELRITRQAELTAETELQEARGKNSISIDVNDSVSRRKSEGSAHSSGNSLGVSVSMPIYTGGANEANIDSRELNIEAMRLTTDRERENLKYNVIKAYYNAVESYRKIAVQQETVSNYEAHLRDITILHNAGATARIDVLRADVELANARQNLIKAENAYEVTLVILRNLLNIDRHEPLTLTTDVIYSPLRLSMAECLELAMDNRLDLQVAEYELERSELAVKSAKAGYKPTVNLSLGTGYSSQFKPRSDNSYDISASVGINWNIFDSGVTKAQVERAMIARDTAYLKVVKTRENIDSSVREAYYNMSEAEHRFYYTGEAVAKAEEDYFIASERYRAGEGIILDVLDAQLALSTARFNDISARYDYARYRAEVENLMGNSLTLSERHAGEQLRYVTAGEREA